MGESIMITMQADLDEFHKFLSSCKELCEFVKDTKHQDFVANLVIDALNRIIMTSKTVDGVAVIKPKIDGIL